jgi:cytoskeletal protein CcmA (bactofilin family)
MKTGPHGSAPELAARQGARASSELMALLGEGAEFEGKLVFEGRVRIDGKFRGDIVSDGTLVIGDRAEVEATIAVGVLIVLGGTVRGEVSAQHTVELHAPSKVYGNITAPQLMIDRGVVFEGQSRLTQPPSDHSATKAEAQTVAASTSTPDE